MASTRDTLAQIDEQLAESMGVRSSRGPVRLSPAPRPQDIGRRPTAGFGRIDIDMVVPDAQQPRTEISPEAIERLAASIREQGQLTPIRVRWSGELGKWLIIAGERRWRATKHAGLPTIECYFHEQELTSSQILEQQLIENLLREDLKPVEEARAFTELMKMNAWTGKQVAAALCIPASKVSRSLALLRLPEDVQCQVDEGQISARTAYELSRLPDSSERTTLVNEAASGELTHTQAAQAVRQRRSRNQRLRCRTKAPGVRLTFQSDDDWYVVVHSPQPGTYHHVEQALLRALEEVRHRIANNVQIL